MEVRWGWLRRGDGFGLCLGWMMWFGLAVLRMGMSLACFQMEIYRG